MRGRKAHEARAGSARPTGIMWQSREMGDWLGLALPGGVKRPDGPRGGARVVSQNGTVVADILLSHSFCRKALLKGGSDAAPVELMDALDGSDGLLLVIDDETAQAVVDYFGNRSTAKRDHTCPTGHRLDHNQAERFGPIDRKQQGGGASQKITLGIIGKLPDNPDLLAVDRRLKALSVVPCFGPRDLGGHAQGHV